MVSSLFIYLYIFYLFSLSSGENRSSGRMGQEKRELAHLIIATLYIP